MGKRVVWCAGFKENYISSVFFLFFIFLGQLTLRSVTAKPLHIIQT